MIRMLKNHNVRGSLRFNQLQLEKKRLIRILEHKKKVVEERPEITDPDFLIPDTVMLFTNNSNVFIQDYPKKAAQNLIRKGRAYVLSSEAIAMYPKN